MGQDGKQYKVTVTPAEQHDLVLKAAANRMSVPYLLVQSALADKDGMRASSQELDAVDHDVMWVLRQLSAIGNNLNQIARVANSTGEIQPGLEPAIDRITALTGRVQQTVDAVDGLHR